MFKPFYNTFQFTRHGKIIEPAQNGFAYAQLSDYTIVQIRYGIVSIKSPLSVKNLQKGQNIKITFTEPTNTKYPQAIKIECPHP